VKRIVVVGQGAAGLCAALSAAEAARARNLGAEVTLIDRAPESSAGGNTRWSPSYIRMQSPDAVDPRLVDEIVAESGGRADRAYFERLAAEAPATIGWLQGLGLKFHQPTYYLAKGPARIQPVGGGGALIEGLVAAARAAGVFFEYERKVASIPGLEADAVVLACGGFEGNRRWLREHFGPGAEDMRLISPGGGFNDGAGIAMALAAGARRAGDWDGMHAEPVDARSQKSAPVMLLYPYGIVVDGNGRRFCDEGAGLVHETWEHFARDLHFRVPGRQAWAILDASILEVDGHERAVRSEVPPLRSESLRELAELLEMPELMKTVTAYNAACTGDASRFDATRKDGLAAAPGLSPAKSNWARPLTRAPFLAWPLQGALAYTFGGIETDAEARVIGASGPIPNLYAAGEITGHFHGTAPNAIAVLRALVFGRIAGRSAVR
jgi:tricarballylate dehydrogenase